MFFFQQYIFHTIPDGRPEQDQHEYKPQNGKANIPALQGALLLGGDYGVAHCTTGLLGQHLGGIAILPGYGAHHIFKDPVWGPFWGSVHRPSPSATKMRGLRAES